MRYPKGSKLRVRAYQIAIVLFQWSLEKENPEDNPEKKKTQIDL